MTLARGGHALRGILKDIDIFHPSSQRLVGRKLCILLDVLIAHFSHGAEVAEMLYGPP